MQNTKLGSPDELELSDSSGKLVDTLSFVLSFLRDVGLRSAEQALVQEISEKFPDFAGSAAESEELDEDAKEEPAAAATSAAKKASTALDRNTEVRAPSEPVLEKVLVAEPVFAPRPDRLSRESSSSLKSSFFVGLPPPSLPWGGDVDEYDNMDDVGYSRKPVLSQRLFIEFELDLNSEEGSEGYFVHKAKGSGPAADNKEASVSNSDEEDEDETPQLLHELQHGSGPRKPPSPTKMPESVLAHCFSHDGDILNTSQSLPEMGALAPHAASSSTTWDMDTIKIADPVVIASNKSDTRSESKESKPVLSRVESLSSSFKDFDLERLEDDQYIGGRSHEALTSDPTDTFDADMVEFSTPGPGLDTGVMPVDLEMFTGLKSGEAHSRTSSTGEATRASWPPSQATEPVVILPAGVCLAGETSGQEDSPAGSPIDLAGPKESCGGFSFPIASSPEDVHQRVYKSWPSVKSSASDAVMNANLGDAVDYMDEGYRSKLSSRAPSTHETGSRTSPGSPVYLRRCHTHSDSGMSFPPSTAEREASLVLPGKEVPEQVGAAEGERLSSGGGAGWDGAEEGGAGRAAPSFALGFGAGAVGVRAPDARAAVLPAAISREGRSEAVAGEWASASAAADEAELWDPREKHPSLSGVPDSVVSHLIGSPDADGLSRSAGSLDMGLLGTSIARDDEDGDSASLVGSPLEGVLDWQVIPGAHEEEDEEEGDDEEEGSLQPSATGGDTDQQDAELQVMPRYSLDESGAIVYHYDLDFIHRKYEIFPLQIIHRRHRTGFEETKDFPIRMNDLIAGRYQVMDFLGAAAFSRAVQALDIKTNTLVCLKIVKNNKDYFDQSLDEIKLLKFVNQCDPEDEQGVVRLYDYFYYKEHLFLVCELLRANLYEFQKYNKESGEELYFTNARIQKIATSVLKSLAFLHSLDLIHSDLKPENILVKSYSRCEVKTIDLGSSCFTTDQLSSYVQSRSYRAPEVIVGLPYDQKVDVWSLGCILAELSSGFVLFQNDSVSTLLARLEGILGPMPEWMVRKGRYSHRFFTKSGHLFERSSSSVAVSGQARGPSSTGGSAGGGGGSTSGPEPYELLVPKKTSLRHRLPEADPGLLDFVSYLLCVDPHKRPTAAEAMDHPWLQQKYLSLDSML